jgi:thiamine-phosphate pyrophosphorylase
MITCVITDRKALRGESLLDAIARNLRDGVTWLQIREKDLPARKLYELILAARALPNPANTKLIVNTRADVALAAGADGVHFPSHSPDLAHWRKIAPQDFLLGVSCHTPEEVRQANADYILYGPVFAPLSKTSSLAPCGLSGLADAARSTQVPVLALGGITRANASSCITAGAVGISGISLFLP